MSIKEIFFRSYLNLCSFLGLLSLIFYYRSMILASTYLSSLVVSILLGYSFYQLAYSNILSVFKKVLVSIKQKMIDFILYLFRRRKIFSMINQYDFHNKREFDFQMFDRTDPNGEYKQYFPETKFSIKKKRGYFHLIVSLVIDIIGLIQRKILRWSIYSISTLFYLRSISYLYPIDIYPYLDLPFIGILSLSGDGIYLGYLILILMNIVGAFIFVDFQLIVENYFYHRHPNDIFLIKSLQLVSFLISILIFCFLFKPNFIVPLFSNIYLFFVYFLYTPDLGVKLSSNIYLFLASFLSYYLLGLLIQKTLFSFILEYFGNSQTNDLWEWIFKKYDNQLVDCKMKCMEEQLEINFHVHYEINEVSSIQYVFNSLLKQISIFYSHFNGNNLNAFKEIKFNIYFEGQPDESFQNLIISQTAYLFSNINEPVVNLYFSFYHALNNTKNHFTHIQEAWERANIHQLSIHYRFPKALEDGRYTEDAYQYLRGNELRELLCTTVKPTHEITKQNDQDPLLSLPLNIDPEVMNEIIKQC